MTVGQPPDAYRWELIENFRKRSDESANQLRALLIAIATAATGFIAQRNYDQLPNWHLVSIVAFALAIWLLVRSWSFQKRKSIRRLIWLRQFGYERYLKREIRFARIKRFRNEELDKCAMRLIAIGAGLDLGIQCVEGFLRFPPLWLRTALSL